jgi:hypothetical protein
MNNREIEHNLLNLLALFVKEMISRNKTAPKKISSGVDYWYLDNFFEKFICGR